MDGGLLLSDGGRTKMGVRDAMKVPGGQADLDVLHVGMV